MITLPLQALREGPPCLLQPQAPSGPRRSLAWSFIPPLCLCLYVASFPVCLLGHWSLDFAPILTLGCSLPNDPKLSYICKDPSPNEVTGSGDQDLDRRLGEPHFNPLQPCNIQYVPVKKGVSHRYFEAL